jgi:hypothetical protein
MDKQSFFQKSAEFSRLSKFPLVRFSQTRYQTAGAWGVEKESGRVQQAAFSLLSDRTDTEYAYQSGAALLEHLVKRGNTEKVVELLPQLQKQFALYRAIVALARRYQKSGGKIATKDASGIYTEVNHNHWTDLSINKDGVFNLKIPVACKSPEILSGDWSSMDRWLLWASRLLRDAEIRCARAVQHRPA